LFSTINIFLAVFCVPGVEAQEMPASAKAAVLIFLAGRDHPEIYRGEISLSVAIYCQVKISGYQVFFMYVSATTTGDDIIMFTSDSAR
jgi:hypothetical protein